MPNLDRPLTSKEQKVVEEFERVRPGHAAIAAQNISWDYLLERVRRYNENPSDDLLYRIGTHVDVLTLEDQDLIEQQQGGYLNPQQRYRVLNWLTVHSALT
jgi:hypothetical protein